jgi:hypothetical protein
MLFVVRRSELRLLRCWPPLPLPPLISRRQQRRRRLLEERSEFCVRLDAALVDGFLSLGRCVVPGAALELLVAVCVPKKIYQSFVSKKTIKNIITWQ